MFSQNFHNNHENMNPNYINNNDQANHMNQNHKLYNNVNPQPYLHMNGHANLANDFNNMSLYQQKDQTYLQEYHSGLPGYQQNYTQKNKYHINRPINLFQYNQIFPYEAEKAPVPALNEHFESINCSTEFMRCSLTTIPQTHNLLDKVRLPLGLMIHPFNDKQELPLITDQVMSRCRVCRTYINPFVVLLDNRHWRCNICYRTNELPEEYYFDSNTGGYIQPYTRIELQQSAVEFIASSDYMVRPPQPAVYLFVLEVSASACKTNYLKTFCETLLVCLDDIPSDSRTQIGFVTFNSHLHFYQFLPGSLLANHIECPDYNDFFIPCDDGLLVNLMEYKESVQYFLQYQLPSMWCINSQSASTSARNIMSPCTNGGLTTNNKTLSLPHVPKLIPNNSNTPNTATTFTNNGNCLGSVLQTCHELIKGTGGRISLFLCSQPDRGVGELPKINTSNAEKDVSSLTLTPHTDFYKRLSLDMNNDHVCTDIFFVTPQPESVDLLTIGMLAKYSAGSIYHFLNYIDNPTHPETSNLFQIQRFEQCLKRYLTRDVGFEAVLRVRSSKGLTPITFYGNHFLRSSNLLCLPCVKPDTSFAVHYDVNEDLLESNVVCLQAAILYTTSHGERRIRVLTQAYPVSNSFDDIINGADQDVVVSLIAIMASERFLNSNLHSAREAIITSVQDFLQAYNTHAYITVTYSTLMCPQNCTLIPYRIHALLKNPAFVIASNNHISMEERVFATLNFQTDPVDILVNSIYPALYDVNYLVSDNITESQNDASKYCSYIPIYQLTYKSMDERTVYLMDLGMNCLILYVNPYVPSSILSDLFPSNAAKNTPYTGQLTNRDVFNNNDEKSLLTNSSEMLYKDLDETECELQPTSRLNGFIECLQNEKPFSVPTIVIKQDGDNRYFFKSFLYDDRTENSMSSHEFLLYLVKEISE